MQWLYEQGFDCDGVYCHNQIYEDNIILNKKDIRRRFFHNKSIGYSPYFTESCLYKILEKVIYISEENGCEYYFNGIQFVREIPYEGQLSDYKSPGKTGEDSLLEYLLDLTIWAVKEGHLKAEGKDDC